MKIEEFKQLVETGREMEFNYNGKRYSITYGYIDSKYVISFCEFYKETTEVDNFEKLISISRDNVTIKEMIETINDNDIDVF